VQPALAGLYELLLRCAGRARAAPPRQGVEPGPPGRPGSQRLTLGGDLPLEVRTRHEAARGHHIDPLLLEAEEVRDCYDERRDGEQRGSWATVYEQVHVT